MAHHKRKGPKSTRAGCLMCKPHKRQGAKHADRARYSQIQKATIAAEQVAGFLAGLVPEVP